LSYTYISLFRLGPDLHDLQLVTALYLSLGDGWNSFLIQKFIAWKLCFRAISGHEKNETQSDTKKRMPYGRSFVERSSFGSSIIIPPVSETCPALSRFVWSIGFVHLFLFRNEQDVNAGHIVQNPPSTKITLDNFFRIFALYRWKKQASVLDRAKAQDAVVIWARLIQQRWWQ